MSGRSPSSFFIETLGCQMNVYDSELLERRFRGAGYRKVHDAEKADVILLNTCSVRRKAELRAWNRLALYRGLQRDNGRPIVVLCGCVGSRAMKGLREADAPRPSGAAPDVIAGCGSYDGLLPAVEQLLNNGKMSPTPVLVEDSPEACYVMPGSRSPSRLRAFVSISRGCDSHCSYCVVPSARGPHRSRPLEEIVAETTDLAEGGTREITLLGQNVNIYRDGSAGFIDVLKAVQAVGDIWRVRFTSPHPKDMSPDVLRFMGQAEKICEYLHLPLQSGSDAMLAAMGRGYTTDQYRRIVETARTEIPGITISTDLMVGFPGETEEHFVQSLEFVRSIRFDAAFTFQYSPRPGTAALDLPGAVPEEVKRDRLKRLIDVQNQIMDEVGRQIVGTTVEVLVDGYDRKDPQRLTGRTRTHKIVSFEGHSALIGSLATVHVESTGRWTALGSLVTSQRGEE